MIVFRALLTLSPVLLLAVVVAGPPAWRLMRHRITRKRLARQEAADQAAGLTPLNEWLASRRNA